MRKHTYFIRAFLLGVGMVFAIAMQGFVHAKEFRNFYPKIEPYHTGYLQVSPIHRIYYEESGNPDGKPVVFLHGGPVGGTWPGERQWFDPKAWPEAEFIITEGAAHSSGDAPNRDQLIRATDKFRDAKYSTV